jgi:hypothetical protein
MPFFPSRMHDTMKVKKEESMMTDPAALLLKKVLSSPYRKSTRTNVVVQ